MHTTFALRRQHIVQGSPQVREFLENWPALRMQSQVFAEFHRITNVNLRNQFYYELDRYTPKLAALYRQKSSRTGKGAEALREMLRIYDLEEEHDINMRRTLALCALPVYLGEDDTEFFKTCNGEDEVEIIDTQLALLSVVPDSIGSISFSPENISIVIEDEVVISELPSWSRLHPNLNMLDPSSSEEEGDEILEVEHKEVAAPKSLGGARPSPGRTADGHGGGGLQPRSHGCGGGRPSSPSPSVGSDKEKEDLEKMQREEEEKKKRLQLYVFVMRCIAYPFNAKQPTDMARRQQKISKQHLQTVKERFQAFLNGETQIVADEAFINAVQSYYDVFLKSDRVSRMVQSGGCSASDSREVFKKHIEKRVRSLPEIDGLSKETVLSSWMAKFDTIYRGEEDPRKHQQRMTASAASELILSKDQLYEMFQQILGIKKFEHQLLYNACQLDNPDEQAAQIRRELDGRLQMADQIARHGGRFPRFASREMEAMFIEELRSSVNLLMANLESMPVSKGGEFKLQKLKRGHNTSIMDMGQEDENTLSKSDVVLSFTLEVGGLLD
ncbi:Calcium-dependent secretion activator 1 [Collichthys lucidus]|uniref:Calcium-dependent secretion activator 1 n=1 Tax=Collichthys lucidus TaxID=240159 RepID=A0A4U5UBL9_COLLU|nr:Calcium-dependent secretion activator 1 [Collichthys lucidus]